MVAVVVFVETLFFTAITPLLPHYVAMLHLTKSGAGVLVAAYPLGTLASAVPSGAFAGRAGVKTAVVAGLALMSAATLVFGLGRSELVVDLARFAQGV
ncbi:MFS transporter, partial [Acidimicrobiaceae bacterium USS-CC1]|nr:MFS transporter [Acidiferrimicrobium australe]